MELFPVIVLRQGIKTIIQLPILSILKWEWDRGGNNQNNCRGSHHFLGSSSSVLKQPIADDDHWSCGWRGLMRMVIADEWWWWLMTTMADDDWWWWSSMMLDDDWGWWLTRTDDVWWRRWIMMLDVADWWRIVMIIIAKGWRLVMLRNDDWWGRVMMVIRDDGCWWWWITGYDDCWWWLTMIGDDWLRSADFPLHLAVLITNKLQQCTLRYRTLV